MKKINKKGFTLVELLAVVVILGVLGAIATTVTSRVIKNTRVSAFFESVKSIYNAAELACSQSVNGEINADDIVSYVKGNNIMTINNGVVTTGTGNIYISVNNQKSINIAYYPDGNIDLWQGTELEQKNNESPKNFRSRLVAKYGLPNIKSINTTDNGGLDTGISVVLPFECK